MSRPELRWSRPTEALTLLVCGATAPVAWRVALAVGTTFPPVPPAEQPRLDDESVGGAQGHQGDDQQTTARDQEA